MIVATAIFSLSILLRTDVARQRLGDYITSLTQYHNIPLTVGSVDIGLFNKLEIEDILLNDLNNDTICSIERVTIYISPIDLLKGKIGIDNITIAKPRINIYRNNPDEAINAQFIIDLLAGNDTVSSTTIPTLRANHLRIYDGEFRYRVLSQPGIDSTRFSATDICVSDIETSLSIKEISPYRIDVHLRRLYGKEKSGLELKNFFARIKGNKDGVSIQGAKITLPNGHIDSHAIIAKISGKGPTENNMVLNGEISSDNFHISDLAPLMPELTNITPSLHFRIPFNATSKNIELQGVEIKTNDNALFLESNIAIKNDSCGNRYHLKVTNSALTPEGLGLIYSIAGGKGAPGFLNKLGEVTTTAEAIVENGIIESNVSVESDCGILHARISPSSTGGYHGNINGENIKIGAITNGKETDCCDINATYSYTYTDSTNYNGQINTTVSSLCYNGYNYTPIKIIGKITPEVLSTNIISNDKNLAANLNLGIKKDGKKKKLNLSLSVDSIIPHNLNFTNRLKESNISFKIEATASGENLDNATMRANIYDFRLRTPQQYWKIRHMHIADNSIDKKRNLIVNSDIINGYLTGYYERNTLGNSFKNILRRYIPSLIGDNDIKEGDNNFVFGVTIKNSDILEKLFDLPISISEMSSISGTCDEQNRHFELRADFNNTAIAGRNYRNILLETKTEEKRLTLQTVMQRPSRANTPEEFDYSNKENDITIKLQCNVADDKLSNNLEWSNITAPVNRGNINLDIEFEHTKEESMLVNAIFKPGTIIHNDSIWFLRQGSISGVGNSYAIKDLSLYGDNRHITINGILGEREEDKLNIDLKNIVLEEVFDLVNFHSVEFGGTATGGINICSLFGNPQIDATLNVDRFKFEGGLMGDLAVRGDWEKENKAIRIKGEIKDEGNNSIINGIVSPANDTINLQIDTNGARIEFLNNMISSIVSDVNSRVYGDIAVRGKLSDINLYGALAARGSMRLRTTNVTYNMSGDTIRLTHNRIGFDNIHIRDNDGNSGIVNGAVSHNSLKNFTCHFNIDANNLLAYHSNSFGDDGFYGTAYITGNADFSSDDNGIRLRAEVETGKNSIFVYNAAGPAGATDNKFVTFIDSKSNKDKSWELNIHSTENENSILSRLNLDFMISVTPDLHLRVYTNTITNDYIDIYGTGPINAIYDEKEGFSMKGHLDLNRGTYKFTMQDIFPKEFTIRSGTLNFNGDPFLADLNLNTSYVVPSASLTDLDLSIERRKNVKVNCLMDITGTLQSPNLTFGLELPDGNEEERELLASATSTPEQTNMQFIYLVGIGKFYTYRYNNQDSESQSSTMMESLISSTISGQLNNMLSQIIDSNWDLTGNFATSEKGWNSMEVEGMLSGRLLDNRLLINGNFGYRENPLANKNFIGDFEVQWLLNKSGNVSLKAYSKVNDRYFSKTTLTTQGAGIMLRHDFNSWLFWKRKEKKNKEEQK